jgi:hypothetical protein
MRVTQMHKIHMIKLSKTKSIIKGLTPWQPKHSLSKIHNKYTTSKYLSEVVRRYETNKENNSLLNRMLEL